MMPVTPILQVEALTVRVGRVTAVSGLDLCVVGGQRWALLGRNGVGKSTLLAALAGLHPVASGGLLCQGRPLAQWRPRALARVRGWLAQHVEEAFAASVLEAVLVGRHPYLGRFEWEDAADILYAQRALASLGIAHLAERNVLTLSGGERQRVAIAALLVQAPHLYLLDEPLTHLDLGGQIQVLEHFSRVATEGAAVVAVLHDVNLALRWCTHMVVLSGEGAWQAGPVATMACAETLGAALGYPLQRVEYPGGLFFAPI